jgi:hypothetical protein
MKPQKRHLRIGHDDTLVSGDMLRNALNEILRRVTLDRCHDIPYLAGYSRDGKTVYIDRHLPRTFVTGGRRVQIDRFLILHEMVEKTLLAELGLHYQHAHQIALRAEEAAVRGARISWRDYDRFMQRYIKEAGDECLSCLPPDLDIKPYRDEHDTKLLHAMQRAMAPASERSPAGRRPTYTVTTA